MAMARLDRVRISSDGESHVSAAGDLDLVVGDEGSLLSYFENTGTSTTPAFERKTGSENPFDDMDAGGRTRGPAFGDLDGDEVIDLIIIPGDGNVRRYRGKCPTWYDPSGYSNGNGYQIYVD